MPFLGVITPKKGKEKSPRPFKGGGRGVGDESAPELKCTQNSSLIDTLYPLCYS